MPSTVLGQVRMRLAKRFSDMATIGVGIIGCGGIALQNHLPGLELCADTRLVGLCDNSAEVLGRAVQQSSAPV
ncbi:MAG: hypothetical protein QF920_03370, partial [Verrucomicrobiota bacterium]|nr:hypothetical protein [Verrucomicrobiota bacterium]